MLCGMGKWSVVCDSVGDKKWVVNRWKGKITGTGGLA